MTDMQMMIIVAMGLLIIIVLRTVGALMFNWFNYSIKVAKSQHDYTVKMNKILLDSIHATDNNVGQLREWILIVLNSSDEETNEML